MVEIGGIEWPRSYSLEALVSMGLGWAILLCMYIY